MRVRGSFFAKEIVGKERGGEVRLYIDVTMNIRAIFLCICVYAVCFSGVMAQKRIGRDAKGFEREQEAIFYLGGHMGLNSSIWSGSYAPLEDYAVSQRPFSGVFMGISAMMRWGKSLYLQSQLQFFVQGSRETRALSTPPTSHATVVQSYRNYHLGYIRFPVLIKYHPFKRHISGFNIQIGPHMGVNIRNSVSILNRQHNGVLHTATLAATTPTDLPRMSQRTFSTR